MANVSVTVEIETRTERDLSNAFQGVADDQSVNVGTLLTKFDELAKCFQDFLWIIVGTSLSIHRNKHVNGS